jgi:hypothetical protein
MDFTVEYVCIRAVATQGIENKDHGCRPWYAEVLDLLQAASSGMFLNLRDPRSSI